MLPFARLALWARVSRLRSEDVDRALWTDRTLVRTWAMRGTLHLLRSEDLPVYVAGLSRALVRHTDRYLGRRGLTPEEARVFTDAVLEGLEQGPLSRRDLADRIVASHGGRARSWIEHAWGGIVGRACLAGEVCFGPNAGPTITFVRRDRWLRSWREVTEDEGRTQVLGAYLRAYGPATDLDLAAWSGLSAKDFDDARDRLGQDLVAVDLDGNRAWLLREDRSAVSSEERSRPVVRLLPNFDAYLLGHRQKSHLVDEAHYKRVYRKAGWISAVLLVDGRVAGVWSHEQKGERLRVRVEAFRRPSRVVRVRAEEEASDLGRFLDAGDVRVAFT